MSDDLIKTIKIMPAEAFVDDADDFSDIDLILFDGKTNSWSYGIDKIKLPTGSKAVAIVDECLKGFARFSDGKPVWRLLPAWPTPDLQALRASLGDLDPALWTELDAKKRPQDPWKAGRKVPVFLGETCDRAVFSTTSLGGVKATSQLNRAVRDKRHDPNTADALPIVSFDFRSYRHTNPQMGTIYEPVFDIEGWTTPAEIEAALRAGHFDKLASAASDNSGAHHQQERRPVQVAAKRSRG
jgi:hypothetical protein